MLLIRDTRELYRHEMEQAVGKDAPGKQVLDHLFGKYPDYQSGTDFVIRVWRGDERTPLQRLNMFWAMPFTLLCAPYQYVAKGQVGWDTKSRLGCWLLKVTGHLHDA